MSGHGGGSDPYGGWRDAPGGDMSSIPAGHQQQVPGVPPPPAVPPGRAPLPGGRRAWWIGGVVAAVVAIGAGGVTAALLNGGDAREPGGPGPSGPPPVASPSPSPTSDDPRPGITVPVPTRSANPSPTPSPSPTSDPEEPTSDPAAPPVVDGRIAGDGYSVAVSDGWLPSAWGENNDGELVNGDARLSIYRFVPNDPAATCDSQLRQLLIWRPGTIGELPDRQVGGLDAPGGSLTVDEGGLVEMRCISHADSVYNVAMEMTSGDGQERADIDAMLDSWQWT
ncbi:hypothetical protein [Litorihabitans aurantiacus]|uniref:Uncharacterized protein n=1 Tax=Litorihabitans aurantiacus TaxID=1930061 RepID=A0AA37XFQ1_9MICO|nr:hypothetical protein [Litorihabitans aurantiacus]GMA32326.1 hypothetical protein GCM10025875_23180 [Litorihabitans aurantiacus]